MSFIYSVVAGLIAFVIGGLWYGLLFKDAWIQSVGMTQEQIENAGNGQKEMVLALVVEVLTALVTVQVALAFGSQPPILVLGMGLVAVLSSLKNYFFEGKPLSLILINESYRLLTFVVFALVAWMA